MARNLPHRGVVRQVPYFPPSPAAIAREGRLRPVRGGGAARPFSRDRFESWIVQEQERLLDEARHSLRIAGAWLELLRDARRTEASEFIRECEREFESAWEHKREAERTALVWFSLSEDDRHRRYLAERIGARGKR
jgi:hypothetical protein